MNLSRAQPSNTRLNISLEHYVAYVQQQMKQTDSVLAHLSQTAERQTKLEQIISRQLVESFL